MSRLYGIIDVPPRTAGHDGVVFRTSKDGARYDGATGIAVSVLAIPVQEAFQVGFQTQIRFAVGIAHVAPQHGYNFFYAVIVV